MPGCGGQGARDFRPGYRPVRPGRGQAAEPAEPDAYRAIAPGGHCGSQTRVRQLRCRCLLSARYLPSQSVGPGAGGDPGKAAQVIPGARVLVVPGLVVSHRRKRRLPVPGFTEQVGGLEQGCANPGTPVRESRDRAVSATEVTKAVSK